MTGITIAPRVEAGLLRIVSENKISAPVVTDASNNVMNCAVFRQVQLEDGSWETLLDGSNLSTWTPDHPVLYFLQADGQRIRFGYSELRSIRNRELLLNGQPCYFRGYIRGIVAHEHPNMTGESLKAAAVKNIRQAKKYGFNLVRFHSTVPSQEFVEAADEEGIFIHMEIGFAYERNEKGQKVKLAMDNTEWRNTILKYRNCPSVAIFCIGNEMHNSGHYPEVKALYKQGRELAPHKLIMDNSGWGEFDRQTADVYSQHIAYFFPFKHHGHMFHQDNCWRMNGSAYDVPLDEEHYGSVKAEIHRTITPIRPTLAHEAIHYIEIPDYDALNKKFDEFCKKVGPEYLAANDINKPRFMTELPKLIARKGLTAKVPDYIAASQKFKKLGIKTYLEKCRLSDLCGFEMLQFADCLKYENKNGIVDCFDDDKFMDADWMMQFNGNAAILADFDDNYVGYYGQSMTGRIVVSDFLEKPSITGADLTLWLERADGTREIFYQGHNVTLVGGLQSIATISFTMPEGQATQKVVLHAELKSPELTLTNSWDFWFYPQRNIAALPAELRLNNTAFASQLKQVAIGRQENAVVTDVLDNHVFADLAAGKTVFLLYHRDAPEHMYYWPGALERFKPCIWDRGSNLGGIVYPKQLQDAIGSGRYFDKNFYDILEGAYKICLDDIPAPVEEIINGVDKPVRDRMKGIVAGIKDFIDGDTLRNFSHLFAVRVGKGLLVVCTLRLECIDKPVVRNFIAELFSGNDWLATDKSIAPEQLQEYLAQQTEKGVRKEDVMNHFWEIDNKLVEDTLFWEQAGLDLKKIH